MKYRNLTAVSAILVFSCQFGYSQQIQHAKTVEVKVYGNCSMCEKTIEKAANQEGLSMANWDQDSKMAKLTFDSTKTDRDALLKRIADVGYDSDWFRAADATYNNLHSCCKYERPAPTVQAPNSKPKTGMVKKTTVCPSPEEKKN